MKLFKKIAVAAAIVTAGFLASKLAQAQPYGTNTSYYGAAQYNNNLTTPLKPSQTLANQYAAGTLIGTIVPGATVGGVFTNTFTTNIFSTPPIVTVTATTNAISIVPTVTTSNFVLTVYGPTNGVYLYWEATGH